MHAPWLDVGGSESRDGQSVLSRREGVSENLSAQSTNKKLPAASARRTLPRSCPALSRRWEMLPNPTNSDHILHLLEVGVARQELGIQAMGKTYSKAIAI